MTTGNGQPRRPSPELLDQAWPGDPEAERFLLGSIMLAPERLAEVSPIIRRDDFSEDHHRLLWDHLEAAPPDVAGDVALLSRWLTGVGDLKEIGGPEYLAQVAGTPPHAQNAKYYAEIVRNLAVKRYTAQAAEQLLLAAHDNTIDVAALRARAAELLKPIDDTPAEAPKFTKLLTGRDLLELDLKPHFLVRGILVEGQPAIVGGRSKTLKTSVAADLAISMGSGTPFLGKFESQQANVGFWSGESGAGVVRETAKRIAASKGVDLADCSVSWSFDLPKLCHLDHLDHFRRTIETYKLQVAIVDPLYLALLSAETAGQAANLFAMGAALQPLSKLAQEAGVTLIVLHHFRKGGQPNEDEPAGLEELTMSGAAEWARQWILLQRRAAYQGDGQHLLWMRSGGSAGHSSLWGVTIEEGQLNPDTFTGRTWKANVAPVADARAQTEADKTNRKAAEQEQRAEEHQTRLLSVLRATPEGDTARALREATGLNGRNFGTAITCLIQEGRAARCQVVKTRGTFDGFKPTGK